MSRVPKSFAAGTESPRHAVQAGSAAADDAESAASTFAARVVESFGRRTIVETPDGRRQAAILFGKKLAVVCGDRVLLRQDPGSDAAQIVQIEPRATLFSRTDSRGRIEPLAANLTLVAVLAAPLPAPDFYILDRYLAGAAFAGLRSAVIFNKSDLLADANETAMSGAPREEQASTPKASDRYPGGPPPEKAAYKDLRTIVEQYRQAGYPVFMLSAQHGTGMEELHEFLLPQVTLLAGQSGVGKTTLLNCLVPEAARKTRSLSDSTEEGRHTTVAAALFHLPSGGELIDSPGVRDYAPAPVEDANIQVGWPEILQRAAACRFNNCMHLREPGCAVLAAVNSGDIAARRYESYKRLLNVMRGLAPDYERRR